MWDWLQKFRVTSTFEQHLRRDGRGLARSLGGTDFAVPVGTPIILPRNAERITYGPNGTGGYTATAHFSDGWRLQFLHLLDLPANRGATAAGTVIARSGGAKGHPGAGSSTGPHVHVHALEPSGRRVAYTSLPLPRPAAPATAPAQSGKLPRSTTQENGVVGPRFWTLVQRWARDHGYTGPLNGVMGVNGWKAIQRHMRDSYGYKGPINGVPGPNLWKAIQQWAQRNGTNPGAIDGKPGTATYKAVATVLNRAYGA